MNSLNVKVRTYIEVNGKRYEVHNTVLDAGKNLIGRRLLDSTYSTQGLWIVYTTFLSPTTTKTKFVGTYAELSTTSHEQAYSWTFDRAAPETWTAMDLMLANTTNDSDRIVTASFSVAITPSDVVKAIFDINFTSDFLNASGLQVLGNRCFNSANAYVIPNYISFYNGAVEQKRYLGTYTNISNSQHKLVAKTDAAVTTNDMRLYNAASGGTSYASNAVSRSIPINENVGFVTTITNTSSTLTTA